MTTVVNEPRSEYKVAGWQPELKDFPHFDDLICGIENGAVMVRAPSISTLRVFSEIPKRKLSTLRGKLHKQSGKEIDDQISDLRSEWDRNS